MVLLKGPFLPGGIGMAVEELTSAFSSGGELQKTMFKYRSIVCPENMDGFPEKSLAMVSQNYRAYG